GVRLMTRAADSLEAGTGTAGSLPADARGGTTSSSISLRARIRLKRALKREGLSTSSVLL
ncbi:MAG: hypothetical protein ACREJT_13140, partial [Myxococcota bacterium]